MPRRLTTREFIAKAQAKYGDRYDYSESVYKHSQIDLTVICRVPGHGAFQITPHAHLKKGRNVGCPQCSAGKPLTTVAFIAKSKAKHGERYDYSQVEYVNNHTKVTILCPDHGPYTQIPNDHLQGKGCKACGFASMKQKQRMTQDEFVTRSKKLHDSRYDYSLVDFVNGRTRVKIICPVHGIFLQMPEKHLTGQGCNRCGELAAGDKRRYDTSDFIAKAMKVHGNRYGYTLVEYVDSTTSVKIMCPDHGFFPQAPAAHLAGAGCAECAGVKKLDTEQFVERASAIHENRYDYSLVKYENAHTGVRIVCPEHGAFVCTPSNHLYGQKGCPSCADYGFDPQSPAVLYYVAVNTDEDDTRYKIGVSNNYEKRFFGADLRRVRLVKLWHFATGAAAAEREAELLHRHSGDRYHGPDILQTGNTELFTHDVLGLDTLEN